MTWTADRLSDLATGYWPAAILNAAVELGVFDALDDGPVETVTIAQRVGGQVDALTVFLDALAALGLVDKSHDGFALNADARPLLSRRSPTCLLDAFVYNGDLYRQWANLADVVLGKGPTTGAQQLGGDPTATRRFVRGMEAKARAFGPALVDAIDLQGVQSLLDVGAGPGTLTRLLAERSPGLRATLLDLPPILAAAKDLCLTSPVADRLAFYPADYRTDALPSPYDGLLYAGALHQETSASAATLLAKCHAALRPGGRIWVIDLMLDASRIAPPFSAMFQVNMLLLRPGARVFGVDETAALLSAADFTDVFGRTVEGTPYCLVGGRLR